MGTWCCSPKAAGPASFRSIPGYREVSVHRYLPATALTFDGLAGRPEPGEMVLAANYATVDPEVGALLVVGR